MNRPSALIALVGFLSIGACSSGPKPPDPGQLRLAAPIDRWDEAIPLGNGLTGGLLWGANDTLRLSLDRGDLWDQRTPEAIREDEWTYDVMKRLKEAGDHEEHRRIFDEPYDAIPYPTKIPAGRIEIDLGDGVVLSEFTLDLASAEGMAIGEVGAGQHATVRAFYSAVEPMAMLRIDGSEPTVRILPPASVEKLGYAPAAMGSDTSHVWFVQETVEGLVYAGVAGWVNRGDVTEMAIAVTRNDGGADPVVDGMAAVDAALNRGYGALRRPHDEWWASFWGGSRVAIPDPALQHHYNFVRYLFGAGSRKGAPPIPLQGVWTADEGNLPPWKGDYHNDLNTQMTYLPVDQAGLMDAGDSFLDFNWDRLPQYQAFARRFYDVDGAVIPGVMSLDGKPLGGWGQYSLSPTNGAWVAWSFYQRWRYTMDNAFLHERALPFCSHIAAALYELLEPDESGLLKLPLSTSPEVHDNSYRAWLEPNSNYDQALMAWIFGAVAEMSHATGDTVASMEWRSRREALGRLDTGEDGALTFARGEPFAESHRHFSHLMAIHPLGTLDYRRPEDRAVIDASLDRTLAQGTQLWVGYSFSWMASLLARAGRGDQALQYLTDYERAFILRNGFHANGDQIGAGLSAFRYRPVTLEGNMLAMDAVHSMLLQSQNGLLSIFPACPEAWSDVSFDRLHAEGGFVVSATRSGGQTSRLNVHSTRGGTLRIVDPFPGRDGTWSVPFTRDGDTLLFETQAGQSIQATI